MARRVRSQADLRPVDPAEEAPEWWIRRHTDRFTGPWRTPEWVASEEARWRRTWALLSPEYRARILQGEIP